MKVKENLHEKRENKNEANVEVNERIKKLFKDFVILITFFFLIMKHNKHLIKTFLFFKV